MKIKTAILTIVLILCCVCTSFASIKQNELEKLIGNLNFSYEELYKYQMKHIDSYLKKRGVKQCRIDIQKRDFATIIIEIYIKDTNKKYYVIVDVIRDRLTKYQAI